MAGIQKLTGSFAGVAETMLAEISTILEQLKIPYVLDNGTLLGIIRENRLLPWDSDMDISITADQVPLLLRNRWRIWGITGWFLTGIQCLNPCPNISMITTAPFNSGIKPMRCLQIPKAFWNIVMATGRHR